MLLVQIRVQALKKMADKQAKHASSKFNSKHQFPRKYSKDVLLRYEIPSTGQSRSGFIKSVDSFRKRHVIVDSDHIQLTQKPFESEDDSEGSDGDVLDIELPNEKLNLYMLCG